MTYSVFGGTLNPTLLLLYDCCCFVGGMMFRGNMRGGMPRGGFVPRGGDVGNRPVRSAPPPQLKFDGEFDFESANAQFHKDKIEQELKEKLTISK